ncbi:MAG: RNA polymerase sporulation sigma factor SigE [Ruminococcaceae bacterium]|nr:RNA polymerase sporulation sigma factor SigE [Oscillospiraceae bacterium]
MLTKLKVFLLLAKSKLLAKFKICTQGNIFYIGGADSLPPPLSIEEENALLSKMSEDVAGVRSVLIERNLRLVVYIAKKFENTNVNVEDLISIGTIGLIKAINTFVPEKNIKLATYASRCIENEILMHLRRTGKQKSEVSFDEPLKTDWDGNELLLSDVLGTDTDSVYKDIDNEVDHQLLFKALDSLNMREKTIMDLRFGLTDSKERTQKEVADMLGISQSYISRLEKKILCQLKQEMLKMS